MTIVENKRVSGLYTNPEQIFDDLSLMMDNAFTFFSRDSRQSQDAIALHRVSVRKYMDLKGEHRAIAYCTAQCPCNCRSKKKHLNNQLLAHLPSQ